MIKLFSKVFFILILTIFLLVILFYIFYRQSLKGYIKNDVPFQSELAESLKIFEYNRSQHRDPVDGCWYDSGDYLIFLPRNAESLFYLSLAYKNAPSGKMKEDLKWLIDEQLFCLEKMLDMNYKQFRDQASHGIHLPPFWNSFFYPSKNHFFESGEGGDVLLMLGLIYENLNQPKKSEFYKLEAKSKKITVSAECCELGPLFLSDEKWFALRGVAYDSPNVGKNTWGIQFSSLHALEQKEFEKLKGLFRFLEDEWQRGENPFIYLGGNYDIAGTIALERLYAQQSGDDSFKDLSDDLYVYLKGQNQFDFDFTQPNYIYHPCSFFNVCKLKDTLINGPNEKDQKKIQKNWQNSEVQLVGQAQYVLMKVLYLE